MQIEIEHVILILILLPLPSMYAMCFHVQSSCPIPPLHATTTLIFYFTISTEIQHFLVEITLNLQNWEWMKEWVSKKVYCELISKEIV